MFSAIEFPLEQAHLTEFSDYLKNLQFPHRLSEHEGKIVLWVYESEHVEIAQELYHRFQLMPEYSIVSNKKRIQKTSISLLSYPVTFCIIALSVFGFFIVFFQLLDWLSFFSFQGFTVAGDTLQLKSPEEIKQLILQGEWWRLISPAFLHFDIMHLVFNLTITWFLGSQIERIQGSFKMLVYVLLMALISNVAQFYYSPDHLFGGMSGVNYGLLGYCGVLNYRYKKSYFNLPVGFFIVSVISMLLGFFNFFSLFGYHIANWAHLAGFFAGIFLALLEKIKDKMVF